MSAVLSRRGLLKLSGSGLTVALFSGCALPVIPKRPTPSTPSVILDI